MVDSKENYKFDLVFKELGRECLPFGIFGIFMPDTEHPAGEFSQPPLLAENPEWKLSQMIV